MKFVKRWMEQDRDDVGRVRSGETFDGTSGPDLRQNLARWIVFGTGPFVPLLVSEGVGWERGRLWYLLFFLAWGWFLGVVGLMIISFWKAYGPPSD